MRTEQGSLVTIEDDRTGYLYPGSICKCGGAWGPYLKSNYAPRPGSSLRIHIAADVTNGAPCVWPAVIRWRRTLRHSAAGWSYV